MNTQHIRQGFTARIGEARTLLALARVTEAEARGRELPATANLLKGQIFVALYGALEYTISQATEAYLNELTDSTVRPAHLRRVLSVVALDSELTAARSAGEKRKWPTRRAIFERMEAMEPCAIPDNAFGTFLHNIWPSTIQELFDCLGIQGPITTEPREIPYLKEIVEKRNEVAHGRSTAEEVGARLTSDETQTRLDATYSACLHFLTTVEQSAATKQYVEPRYRRYY